MKRIIVSGGFDPIHYGHVRLIHDARLNADYVILILNNDNWLKKKKGFNFMPENERKEILEALRDVSEVIITKHIPDSKDPSVCNELKELKSKYPDDELIFANGGDRKADNIPEYTLCDELGIQMLFNIGGEKLQSSSDLVKKAKKENQ